jgi:hypothetical protein
MFTKSNAGIPKRNTDRRINADLRSFLPLIAQMDTDFYLATKRHPPSPGTTGGRQDWQTHRKRV